MNVRLNTTGIGDTFEYVYSGDDCVDTESDEYNPDLYLETGDPQYLPLTTVNERPTVFHLKRLSGRRKATLTQLYLDGDNLGALFHAIKYGLVSVDNGDFRLRFERDEHGAKALTEDCIDVLYEVDESSLFIELATRIITASSGQGEPEKK